MPRTFTYTKPFSVPELSDVPKNIKGFLFVPNDGTSYYFEVSELYNKQYLFDNDLGVVFGMVEPPFAGFMEEYDIPKQALYKGLLGLWTWNSDNGKFVDQTEYFTSFKRENKNNMNATAGVFLRSSLFLLTCFFGVMLGQWFWWVLAFANFCLLIYYIMMLPDNNKTK